ncbi:MAG TPA: hypothetical protein VFO16_05995 [Pseudonocardiaceae bacterium]|nr:hypothetical protein [Pseudonocardiaceae bacterium]
MVEQLIAKRVLAVQRILHPFFETVLRPPIQGGQTMIANFLTGDPQELPPSGFVETLRRYSVPTSSDWLPTVSSTSPPVGQPQSRWVLSWARTSPPRTYS